MTRRERRSVATLLRRARPFIEQRKETFICHALYAARVASKRRTTQYQYNIVWAVTEKHNGDPYAATRRAIVRAAAEIGRSME